MREYRRRRQAQSRAAQPAPSSDPVIPFTDRHAWLRYALALLFAIAFFIFIYRFDLPSDQPPSPQ
jgi:hypothetical protein